MRAGFVHPVQEHLRDARKEQGVSLRVLVERIAGAPTASVLAGWETGSGAAPSLKQLHRWAMGPRLRDPCCASRGAADRAPLWVERGGVAMSEDGSQGRGHCIRGLFQIPMVALKLRSMAREAEK